MNHHQITGELKRGIVIGGRTYKHFVLREADVAMMEAAEEIAPVSSVIAYTKCLMLKQLVSVKADDGTVYTGPFTPGQLDGLKSVDYHQLRRAQAELDKLGETEPSSEQTS